MAANSEKQPVGRLKRAFNIIVGSVMAATPLVPTIYAAHLLEMSEGDTSVFAGLVCGVSFCAATAFLDRARFNSLKEAYGFYSDKNIDALSAAIMMPAIYGEIAFVQHVLPHLN